MDKIIAWFIDFFSLKCPSCGSKMYGEFYDMEIDKMVYKCESCGKQWV